MSPPFDRKSQETIAVREKLFVPRACPIASGEANQVVSARKEAVDRQRSLSNGLYKLHCLIRLARSAHKRPRRPQEGKCASKAVRLKVRLG